MRVLVFCDDLYHPAATVRTGLAGLASAGLAFDWIEDAAGWQPSQLDAYRVVLLSKSNVCAHNNRQPWLVGPTENALGDFVRRGGGLVAVHSGTAGYHDWAAMRQLLGGVFTHHPPPGPMTVAPHPGHPLCRGVDAPFTVHDEHYHVCMDDPNAEIFLTSHSSNGSQPAGWRRTDGLGQVIALTPGHFADVWLHPAMQQLLANALAAAAGRD